MQGRLAEGILWATRRDEAQMRANPSAANRLAFSLDTAFHALQAGDPTGGRAAVQRGLTRHPTDSMPPGERPWDILSWLAAGLGDAPLARLALAGFERDLASTSVAPAGERASYAANVALAEQRWDEAIRLLHEADTRTGIDERYAMAELGRAHDQAGRSDSAVVYYEKFLTTPDAFPIEDGRARAQIQRRLGELYEAAGNTRRAMEHYGQFVKLWARADPPLQAQVAEVRKRLEQLRAKVG
jgi:tetratricopeptide (TPR) repeat protein